MYRTMLKSTIHRATVTKADVDRIGAVTVDEDLMDAADLLAGEQVTVVDLAGGTRTETYVLPGERGSGVLGVNGPVARVVACGDLVMLVSHAVMDDARARGFRPRVVLVDERNRPVEHAHRPDAQPAETDDAARLDALIQAGA
jgi:aspartate 1-decarboxylase